MYGKLIPIAAAGVLLTLGAAIAATATGTFTVQMAIVASCSVDTSGGSLDFGSRSTVTSNVDATKSIVVNCSHATGWNVGLSGGAANDINNRRMSNGSGDNVTYQLYRDSNRTQVWGQTVGTDTVSGNTATSTLVVYGRVPSQGTPALGSYSDTITVTVTY